MHITWLGHSGFRIEIEDAVLLIDPWLTGNPMFPAGREDEAVAGRHPYPSDPCPWRPCLGCRAAGEEAGDQGPLHP